MSEEIIGMYTAEEIYEELANGFLHRSMVDAMYFQIKDLQQKVEQLESNKITPGELVDMLNQELVAQNKDLQQKVEQLEKEKDYLDDYNRHLHNENKQLENIRKEVTDYVNKMWLAKLTPDTVSNTKFDLLNIVNKGSNKE